MFQYSFSRDFKYAHEDIWPEYFKIAGVNPKDSLQILEVGTYEGNTATWFSDHMLDHSDSILTCIDNFSAEFVALEDNFISMKDRFLHNISVSKNAGKIHLIEGDSKLVLKELVDSGKQYDLIYVDGSHHALDVISDGLFCFQLLKPNGLLMFDDDLFIDKDGNQPVRYALTQLKMLLPSMEPIIPEWAGQLPLGDTWEKLFTKR